MPKIIMVPIIICMYDRVWLVKNAFLRSILHIGYFLSSTPTKVTSARGFWAFDCKPIALCHFKLTSRFFKSFTDAILILTRRSTKETEYYQQTPHLCLECRLLLVRRLLAAQLESSPASLCLYVVHVMQRIIICHVPFTDWWESRQSMLGIRRQIKLVVVFVWSNNFLVSDWFLVKMPIKMMVVWWQF